MEFGFTRRVQENYIDLDQMSKDGRIDREIEGYPNGYYPIIIVPQYLIGKKSIDYSRIRRKYSSGSNEHGR